MISAIILLVFPICLVLAALTDFLEMTIPNRIPIILAGAFVLVAPFSGLSSFALSMHLAAGAIVFAVCFALFALNAMGGGDAKLLPAAALWFGLNLSLVSFLLYVSIAGGVLTLVILLLRANANAVMAMGLPLPHSIFGTKKVPYGIAIGIAGLCAFPQSPFFAAALSAIR